MFNESKVDEALECEHGCAFFREGVKQKFNAGFQNSNQKCDKLSAVLIIFKEIC